MKTEILIKSKERVKRFAEVFTPEWVVHHMLDLLDDENGGKPGLVENIHNTILEPACGEGAFLTRILERRLPYCKTNWERLIALSTLYGVEIQEDNVLICRKKLFEMVMEAYDETGQDTIDEAITYCAWAIIITTKNIIQGDCIWGLEEIRFTTWNPVRPYEFEAWETGALEMMDEEGRKDYFKRKEKRRKDLERRKSRPAV